MKRCSLLAATALLLSFVSPSPAADLEAGFRNPPAAAKPWVFWYWMYAAISREGITADLEAMKAAGIGGAYLLSIQGPTDPPLMTPPVNQLTPEWWDMIRHAMSEAGRLGIDIAMQDCDGFATAGGPWITPELSMQKVVWSETRVAGGSKIETALPQPPAKENYYKDIAVFAVPALAEPTPAPVVTTSNPGVDAGFLADPQNRKAFRSEGPCWIQFAYPRPFTCRSIVIRPETNNTYQSNRLTLESSDDGTNFQPVARLEPPRHGWQDRDTEVTHAIPPTTARFFRFSWDKAGSEPGAEDIDSAKWKAVLKLRGIELSGTPRIHQFEGKSGVISRISPRTTAEQLPDALCVPEGQVLDITRHFNDGRLTWDVPSGNWTILRMGHTSTGQHNETGGAAKGLECDKFNPVAIRLQFDKWFGEVIRQIGPDLAKNVLKGFHVDSWECGSQNWSPVFAAEFKQRRGYDLLPFLPALAGVPIASADRTERFLQDVRQTISDLITDNFYATMAGLAKEHGCFFSGENVAPVITSDSIRHFQHLDLPMGEFWLRSPTHDKPNDMHDAISGARIYGKPLVAAEAFTELREAWDETPAMLKPLADRNYALGINRLIFHVFVHNPWPDRKPGMTLGGVGTFLQRDQTWWPDAHAFVDYTKRSQFLLQQGVPVADIAVFTGEELPLRSWLPDRMHLPPGIAHDSINPDALLRLATVRDGRIELPGGADYRLLWLPKQETASPQLSSKLNRLRAAGARIVIGDLPAPLGIEPDFTSSAEGIVWTHRKLPDADLYFVSNPTDKPQTFDASLRVAGKKPELWDAVSGEIRQAGTWRIENGRTHLPLRLDAGGSIFVVLRTAVSENTASTGSNWREPKLIQALDGPWTVTFDPKSGGPDQPVTLETLASWTTRPEPGIKHYSGTATYTRSFDHQPDGRRVWLDLGRVADVASVTLNGKSCGVAWTAPWRVEITSALKPGKNDLRIAVTNTWANRLIGDHALPENQRLTWTNAPFRLDKTPLAPAGLLGPVSLAAE